MENNKGCCSCCCHKCFMIFNFILAVIPLIISLYYNYLCFKKRTKDDDSYQNLINNWKSTPISSISLNSDYYGSLNYPISKEDEEFFLNKVKLEHMNESFYYEDLLTENISDKNYRPCGIDSLGNALYFPLDVECPINEIEVTTSRYPSNSNYRYTTIRLYNNIYLHYSNNNASGYLINNFKVIISSYQNWEYESEISEYKYNFSIPIGDSEIVFIFPCYIGYPVKYDTGKEKRNLFYNFYFIFHRKTLSKISDIFSFAIFLILLVLTIIILITDKLSGLHLVVVILSLIAYGLRLFVFFYFNLSEIIAEDNEEENNINTEMKEDIIILITFGAYGFFYCVFFSLRIGNSIYYYLVYIFRYGFYCQICECCKKRKREKFERELNAINEENNSLINKLKENKRQLLRINQEIQETSREIEVQQKLLEEKKRSAGNNVDINIQIQEETEIEIKIKNFEESHKSEVDKFNELKKQINEIEKQINFYKLKKCKNFKNSEGE